MSMRVSDYLAGAERVRRAVAAGTYLGPAVVQAPGAWTRVGPTWLTEVGWVVIGPGARSWGTTEGLAELATAPTAKPQWHAEGVAVVPDPHLAYFMLPAALDSGSMGRVAELARQASELDGEQS